MKKKTKIVTSTLITITAAVLCAAILITVITHRDWFAASSSTNSDTSSVIETIIIEQIASDETTTSETEPEPQETSSQQPTSQPTSQPSAPHTSSSAQVASPETPKVNDSTGIVFAEPSTSCLITGVGLVPIREAYEKGYIRIKIINGLAYKISTMNGVEYVCEADPETGISYDGESPIIYTYPDGTTGTECRDGATYEWLPGMERTVHFPKDSNGRIVGTICEQCGKPVGRGGNTSECEQFSKSTYCSDCGQYVYANICHYCPGGDVYYCDDCGKPGGDGWGGTCLRFWSGDNECYSCGEIVPEDTCHTCTKGCKSCGKPLGYGTNGTCYRDFFNDTPCPSCGKTVPYDTCHSCNE